jgi:hypothetical protein
MGEALTERLAARGDAMSLVAQLRRPAGGGPLPPSRRRMCSSAMFGWVTGDGTELARALPETWQRVPWIYITGYGSGRVAGSRCWPVGHSTS